MRFSKLVHARRKIACSSTLPKHHLLHIQLPYHCREGQNTLCRAFERQRVPCGGSCQMPSSDVRFPQGDALQKFIGIDKVRRPRDWTYEGRKRFTLSFSLRAEWSCTVVPPAYSCCILFADIHSPLTLVKMSFRMDIARDLHSPISDNTCQYITLSNPSFVQAKRPFLLDSLEPHFAYSLVILFCIGPSEMIAERYGRRGMEPCGQ